MNLPSIEELKNSLIHNLDKYVYIDEIKCGDDYIEIFLDNEHDFFISIDNESMEICFDDYVCFWFLYNDDKYLKNQIIKGTDYSNKPSSMLINDVVEEIKKLLKKEIKVTRTFKGKKLIKYEVFLNNYGVYDLIYFYKLQQDIIDLFKKKNIETNIYKLKYKQ